MVDTGRFNAVRRPLDGPQNAKTIQLYDYWRALSADAPFPPRTALDAMAVWTLLGNIMLVDVIGPPLDFRYRLIGEDIIRFNGRSLKGRTVLELLHDDPNQQGVFDNYARVAQTAQPSFTAVSYENVKGAIKNSESCVLPLGEAPVVSTLLIGLVFL